MSVHIVYKQNGAKMMRPVCTREEYLALRNGGEQQDILKAVRQGDESRKNRLVQMNYSCLLETHEHDGGHGHRPPEGGGDARRSRKDT